jgi:hypothetical protein
MSRDRLQLQRFELKYFIPERITGAVRDFVRAYLELDENSQGRPDNSYPIHSIYLDSDSLSTYWETVRGAKNRYKLRMRYYDDRPDSPIYLEIKRRMADAILKQRCAIRRDAVPDLLKGRMPERSAVLSEEPKQVIALQRFYELMTGIHANPRLHIAYLREAWVSPTDDAVRVTMDRQIRASIERVPRLTTEMDRPVKVFDPVVVLELKFTNRFPGWFGHLVQAFDLERRSAAKYADGLANIGEYQVEGPDLSAESPRLKREPLPQALPPNMLEKPA